MSTNANQQATQSANQQRTANRLIYRHLPHPPINLIIRQLCAFVIFYSHRFAISAFMYWYGLQIGTSEIQRKIVIP